MSRDIRFLRAKQARRDCYSKNLECHAPQEVLSVVYFLRKLSSIKDYPLHISSQNLQLLLSKRLDMIIVRLVSKRPNTVIIRLVSKSPDTVVVQLASKSLDTVVVQLASKRPDAVIAWLVSKSPDTVVVRPTSKYPDTVVIRLASKSPETVVVQLTFSRNGCCPVGIFDKHGSCLINVFKFIKMRKMSSHITNKVYMY